MSNAFAPIVRARPCPIFGRPVHQGSLPFDYSPILLLKPFGFRIAPDTLSSGIRRATGSRSVLAVSGFRLRARLDFSIPSCSPGQRGITPAFGYSAPHPSAEGTSTPMIHALPSAHYGLIRLLIHVHARRAACRLPEPARHTSPGMDETSQVPRKELLHVHKVSDCARFFPCKPVRHGMMLPSLQRNEIGTSELDPFVAVGTRISPRPPHRSERALLTHSAPTSSI